VAAQTFLAVEKGGSMSTTAAKLLVFVGERFACLKIIGRANFSSSIDFKTLVNELRQKGYKYFLLDLSECMLMDSTFLGVLAGFGLKMGPTEKDPEARAIELIHPNARITELLENLGVLHLFKLSDGDLPPGTQTTECAAIPGSPSKEEVTRACLEAHNTLMEINPKNAAKFKDVTAFLAEDLKKLKDS
jgi:anti-sigma B factor antagonist